MYIACPDIEATHVEILYDKDEHYSLCNLTVGKVYQVFNDDEDGWKGEETIQADDGIFICSFSLVLNVKWLKEALL